MPTAVRVVDRIQDQADFASALTWAGKHVFLAGAYQSLNGQEFGHQVSTGRGVYAMEVYNPGGVTGGWANGGLVVGSNATTVSPPTNGLYVGGGTICRGFGAGVIGLVVTAAASQAAALVQLQGLSSTSAVREQANVDTAWNAIDGAAGTDATRSADLILSTWTVATAQEGIRIRSAAAGVRLGFFGTTPAARQASGANLTNNVTAGGVNDTIADFTDLTTYSNSAAAIRNDIYQLARKLKQVNDALRLYGLLT